MLLGVIADDFTGASDIANTLAKGQSGEGGLVTSQFMGIPDQDAAPQVEAGVISLKSRSVAPEAAINDSLAALAWLQAQGCRQFVFKYCSTFDSTEQGNIGPVGEALAAALGVKGVVACPAFPAMGRTVYQGHLFVNDRLLNQSGMENHPLTPMRDANIRRWLRLQSQTDVGLVSTPTVHMGAEAIQSALKANADEGNTLVIVDAVSNNDLVLIGKACAEAPLLTGGSGIALGLASNFIAKGLATGKTGAFSGKQGPEAILAGSCSGATREQIDNHAREHPVLAISVDDVMAGRTTASDVVAFISANHGKAPLAYSSGTPEQVNIAQQRYGRDTVSEKLDGLFAQTAKDLVSHGVQRLVVAGGETSGAVALALGLGELAIGPEVSPGVPVLFSRQKEITLALKSGNFGGPMFFTDALSALAGGNHP
ncbi:four-carbon acid sugar kinase family protein [Falsochrobactrum sp. TDYN1]|uniref:3-oxo-tetronate kinase n=1 Tax=Falsochrobactrum tianjinense TaxID=2706015 RepID=A0A949PLW6_9HYPH|nr:3-oxo-tetronate kinase [Falsochrobactrum sp. TDYN1]MBV2143662.1 four-carbon acid sugar kinase family protein [Falsochrobactrum sp. TDYN1]